MKKIALLWFAFSLVFASFAAEESRPLKADVAIYGATPGGIAAALSAAKSGCTVLLVEPTRHVGGMISNGLTHTDYHAFEGLTGSFAELSSRIHNYYIQKYGADSKQAKESMRGTQSEPHVAELTFEAMLKEAPSILVLKQRVLHRVDTDSRDGQRVITSFSVRTPDGVMQDIEAACFIDGTYEGDLMAGADEKFRVGREGQKEFGESLAPEKGDDQLQAYNFRLSMTNVAANRVPVSEPPGYKREDFVDVLPLMKENAFKAVFGPSSGKHFIYKAQFPVLPNGKFDINDVSHSTVRLSMPGANKKWPCGNEKTRKEIFDEHVRYNLGLLYFIQNDSEVPEKYRNEAREYGLCKDEFTDNNHLPEQLYVREARRMVGMDIFTEKDTDLAPGDARCIFEPDAIAIGEYGHNCHGTGHEGPLFGGKHVGEFYKPTMPYQIPYGVIVPRKNVNLLVPVAVSSTHVGFCALRLEPIWMSLGQAAGFAAALSVKEKKNVQDVSIPQLQKLLHADKAATIYTSEIAREHPDFSAVQWWGQQGGLHGLVKWEGPPKRGKNIGGQYNETYPAHEVELNKALDEELKTKWLARAEQSGLKDTALSTAKTRGEFIRKAYEIASKK